MKSLSRVRLFASPWTVAYQASPSMGFSRHGCWHGLPFPSTGDFPDPGIEPRSPTLQAGALPSEPPGKSSCSKNCVPGMWNHKWRGQSVEWHASFQLFGDWCPNSHILQVQLFILHFTFLYLNLSYFGGSSHVSGVPMHMKLNLTFSYESVSCQLNSLTRHKNLKG